MFRCVGIMKFLLKVLNKKKLASEILFSLPQDYKNRQEFVYVCLLGFQKVGILWPNVRDKNKRCGFNSWVGKIPWTKAWQPLQYSCLENPMDKGTCQATFHRITRESDTTEATHYVSLSMHILCVIHFNIFILFYFILN